MITRLSQIAIGTRNADDQPVTLTIDTARIIDGRPILDFQQAAAVGDMYVNRAGDFLSTWTYDSRETEADMIFAETGPDGIEISFWGTIGPDNDDARFIGQHPLSNRYDTAAAPFFDDLVVTVLEGASA